MVTVTFKYEPDEPDADDSTGMSKEEFSQLTEQLAALGADEIEVRV